MHLSGISWKGRATHYLGCIDALSEAGQVCPARRFSGRRKRQPDAVSNGPCADHEQHADVQDGQLVGNDVVRSNQWLQRRFCSAAYAALPGRTRFHTVPPRDLDATV